MNIDEIRGVVKKGFRTKRTCGVRTCNKLSTTKGYCKNHSYECRTKGCCNRVSRLNAKCRVCSMEDNRKNLKKMKRLPAKKIEVFSLK